MSRKNTLQSEILQNQSLSADFISPVTVITYLDNISYQINITTTDSIGNFTVQGSNDYEIYTPTNEVQNAGSWVDLPLGGGIPNANAANDQIIIDMNQVPFKALRISYDSLTAGTGTCDIWILGKQIGG